tara:strand:+ start:6739 stop:7422 length:684 start_codon:yes stop_codon:yes gene_type:complete
MKIYAFICTRQEALPNYTQKLVSYLSRCKIEVNLLVNKESIFDAYKEAVDNTLITDDDVVIFCHDDIEIIMDPQQFITVLIKASKRSNSGFFGVAGTSHLGETAVWWDRGAWEAGKHRGLVLHGTSIIDSDYTYYGSPGRVVCLDGVFLGISGKSLKTLDLTKPDYFEGEWDFYDIHYTAQAYKKGLYNTVEPIFILHRSKGELVGRDSWHKNRTAFVEANRLPMSI